MTALRDASGAYHHKGEETALVTAQLGRTPRDPWRVAARCHAGFPQVLASPPMLLDATPFPTTFWLCCPKLVRLVSAQESAGEVRRWASRVASDEKLAAALDAADKQFRLARKREGGSSDFTDASSDHSGSNETGSSHDGSDPCANVGIAGQKDPASVKCLHAHVALSLVGIKDPIGAAILEEKEIEAALARCDFCKALETNVAVPTGFNTHD